MKGRRGRHRARPWLAVLMVLSTGAPGLMAAPAMADASGQYSGTVLSCHWSLTVDTSGQTIQGQIAGCAKAQDLSLQLDASWAENGQGAATTSVIALNDMTIGYKGLSYTQTLNVTLDAGVDFSAVATRAQDIQNALQQLVSSAEGQAAEYIIENVLTNGANLDLQKPLSDLQAVQQAFCSKTFHTMQQGVFGCDTGSAFGHPCQTTDCPNIYAANPDGATGAVEDPKGSDPSRDQTSLCPGLSSLIDLSHSSDIYVCVPAFVQGDWSAGKKSIVLLPGGALIALPIGGDLAQLTAGPTISSKKAIISVGGLLAGWQATLKAPKIELAGTVFGMLSGIRFQGDHVSVGQVELNDATVGADYNPKTWLGGPLKRFGTMTVPAEVAAGHVEISAAKSFVLGRGSRIDTFGRGGPGGLGASVGPQASPGGETDSYGGTHGGLGGIPLGVPGTLDWGLYRQMRGHAPVYDSPFAPALPGHGGSGDSDVYPGWPGGGVVRIDGHGATVQIDGTVDVSAGDVSNGGNDGYAGGGAGGSIYVTADKLSGKGVLAADGSSFTSNDRSSIAGLGGGGRIAAVYASAKAWKGSMHADGGVDHTYTGVRTDADYKGSGGAGTVFTRSVKFTKSGAVAKGTGPFPAGTLTVDDHLAPSTYPMPDGTPLRDAWNDPKRRLILTGDARVYGHALRFGEVDVLDGAVLTTMGDRPDQSLSVTARTVRVDAKSRIDMTGRGEAGGLESNGSPAPWAGATVPGQRPATDGFGGSHGGTGGAHQPYVPADAHAGSVYDSPTHPTLPGGGGAGSDSRDGSPGGGVLRIDATTLVLGGRIMANGQNSDGPTADDEENYRLDGGAGAGGSILMHVVRLSGGGTVSANGGNSCLTAAMMLAGWSPCNSPDGAAGGGGGGRVALIASHNCGWHGKLTAAGGDDPAAYDWRKLSRGTNGTTRVHVGPGCPRGPGGH